MAERDLCPHLQIAAAIDHLIIGGQRHGDGIQHTLLFPLKGAHYKLPVLIGYMAGVGFQFAVGGIHLGAEQPVFIKIGRLGKFIVPGQHPIPPVGGNALLFGLLPDILQRLIVRFFHGVGSSHVFFSL